MVMGKNARREYLNAIRRRYKEADRMTKKAMLDECCQVCGYHRKYDASYPPGLFVLIFKSQKGGPFDGKDSAEISSR